MRSVLAFLTAVLRAITEWVVVRKIEQGAEAKQVAKQAEAYRTTRKEIDDAPHGDDPDLARRWLHERAKRDRP